METVELSGRTVFSREERYRPWLLAALALMAAEVFGLDTPGKIDVGEKADLVLWSNDPLELIREAELVMITNAAPMLMMPNRAVRRMRFWMFAGSRKRSLRAKVMTQILSISILL